MNQKTIMYMNKDSEIKAIWMELAEAHVSGLVKRAVDIPSNLVTMSSWVIFSICFVLLGLLAAVLYEIFHSPTDIR